MSQLPIFIYNLFNCYMGLKNIFYLFLHIVLTATLIKFNNHRTLLTVRLFRDNNVL